MQLEVFQHKGGQLLQQAFEKAANLRVAAAHWQHDLVARQLGLGINAQGILTTREADVLGAGKMVQALDQLAGLGLPRQLLAKGVQRLLLGLDGDLHLATPDSLDLYAGVRFSGAQLTYALPLRQHPGAHHAHRQQTHGGGGQANRADAAQAFLEDQAVQRFKGAHGRSPRSQ
ncbi:hypothetical protein D3C76_1038560 [compost metagenome]